MVRCDDDVITFEQLHVFQFILPMVDVNAEQSRLGLLSNLFVPLIELQVRDFNLR